METSELLDTVGIPMFLGVLALFVCALGGYDLLMRVLLSSIATPWALALGIGILIVGYAGFSNLREAGKHWRIALQRNRSR